MALMRNKVSADAGSVSIWTVSMGLVVILLVGLGVDFGGRVAAQQEAADAARQSARAGGQSIDRATAMQGQGVQADPEQAAADARSYLAGYEDVSGSVAVTDPETIEVRTHTTYETKFLRIIGVTELEASASATSRVVTVHEGEEQ